MNIVEDLAIEDSPRHLASTGRRKMVDPFLARRSAFEGPTTKTTAPQPPRRNSPAMTALWRVLEVPRRGLMPRREKRYDSGASTTEESEVVFPVFPSFFAVSWANLSLAARFPPIRAYEKIKRPSGRFSSILAGLWKDFDDRVVRPIDLISKGKPCIPTRGHKVGPVLLKKEEDGERWGNTISRWHRRLTLTLLSYTTMKLGIGRPPPMYEIVIDGESLILLYRQPVQSSTLD
ncbi:hypothetical protein CPC08DRAFT_729175 [Agrocybe pediades]|nr:hypothetical protein CPC08DRAFT_729175 [Agrocybe pediades]